jgi:hypothetical protein
VVLKSKSPLQKEDVAKGMKRGSLGDFERNIVTFVSDTTALLCAESLVPVFEAKRGKTKATGALEKALAKANTSKGLVATMIISAEAVQWATPKLNIVPASIPSPAPFLKTKAVLATFDVNDRAELSLSLFTDNAADIQYHGPEKYPS